MSELAPTIRIMPKPIWGLQAALQTKHTGLSLLSHKCAKERERSERLSKQTPCNYFCLRAKETSMDKAVATRGSQQTWVRVYHFVGIVRLCFGSISNDMIRKMM